MFQSSRLILIFESKLYIVEKDQSTSPDDERSQRVSFETLPNVNIRDPSHHKNLPISRLIFIFILGVFLVFFFYKFYVC